MSFFGDFVGGAATAGAGIIGDQIKSQQEFDTRSKLAAQESELAIAREKMLDEFKRTKSAQDGAAIDSGAATAGNQRIADQMNAANGSSLTASNVSEMALTPDVRAKLSIVGRTRAEEYDDKASTAERLGLDGKAKEIRGQQDIELRRSSEDRRVTADENRSKAAAAETARKEKHDEDWRTAQAATAALAQRRLESILSSKGSGGDKSEKVMTFMNGQIRQLNSESDDVVNQMKADLKASEFATPVELQAIRDSYAPKLKEIAKQRGQLNTDFQSLRERFDLPPIKTEKPPEKPSAGVPSLPSGAKQIGTSGGKPVYQTADGKKFIAN